MRTLQTAWEHPLEAAAQHAVLKRLERAIALVRGGLRQGGGAARALLEEVDARLGAFEVASDGAGACATALIAGSAKPAEEFLLIPFGQTEVERPLAGRSFDFTRRHAESAKRWFDALGRKLAIDYEHQTFDRFNTRPDGLRPAAGWIGGLEVREDGLWATGVTWTSRASELLSSGEYRYFSPVIYWTDEDQTDIAALGPVALTNDPAMRGVPALTAGRANGVTPTDAEAPSIVAGDESRASAEWDEAAERLLEAAEASERPEMTAAEAAARTERDELDADWREALEAAQQEAAVLRRELQAQAADHFVERGLREGKIVDATSLDWRDAYLADAEQTEARLARSPVILPTGRVMRLDARGQVAERAAMTVAAQRERLSRWGAEEEDLRAYEQALAAGRVRQSTGR